MQPMQEGQALEHATYGSGVVLTSDAERTVVEFRNVGRKLFVTELMKVRLVGAGHASIQGTMRDSAVIADGETRSEFRKSPRGQRRATSVDDVSKYLMFVHELYSTLRSIVGERFVWALEELQRVEEHQFLHFKAAPGVARRIKQHRELRGMRKIELHRRSGVPLTSLEYYERGARRPSLLALEKISTALDVRIELFLEQGATIESPAIRVLLPMAERLGWSRWRWLFELMVTSAHLPAPKQRSPGEYFTDTERASVLK